MDWPSTEWNGSATKTTPDMLYVLVPLLSLIVDYALTYCSTRNFSLTTGASATAAGPLSLSCRTLSQRA
jgi:hypothetical protein